MAAASNNQSSNFEYGKKEKALSVIESKVSKKDSALDLKEF